MADNLAYTQWKKEGRFEGRVDARKWLNPPGKNKLPIEERGVWGEHMAQKAKQKQQQKQQNEIFIKLKELQFFKVQAQWDSWKCFAGQGI